MIEKNLEGMGKVSSSFEDADVVLINTCSVTHRAARDGVKYIRKIKRFFPEKEILAVGCSVRDNGEIFEEAGATILKQFKYLNNPKTSVEEFSGHTRAFLNLQQGCKGSCTYCIVKKIKKPYFIKQPQQVIQEIKLLLKKHREIVLCGTNFNEYPFISEVVNMMQDIKSDFRWRFSSLPPEAITSGLLDILKNDKRFCRHFHVPLQSASNQVLKNMGRNYKIEQVVEVIETAKAILDDVVFSFDLIVGFPGETQKSFQDSLNFIEKFEPIKVHVFRYSERPGTPAYNFKGKIAENIKKERMERVVEVSEIQREKHFEKAVGNTFELMIENDGYGYTREYLPVKLLN